MEKMMQRKGKKKTMFLIAAVLAAVLVFSAFALSQKLSVQRYVLSTEKLGGPVRLAVVADLHSTLYGEGQEELIAAIRQESPDAVLFVGDIVDDGLSEEPVRFLFEALSPQYPCFYVSGNHEYWSDRYSAIKAMISGCGATVLEGEAAPLVINGQELCIAGVDDPEFWGGYSAYGGYDIPAEWLTQLKACGEAAAKSGAFSVLLSHRPELVDIYRESGFDLVVSGHAHGGQVRIPGLVNGLFAPCQGWFPQYAGGVYALGSTTLVVSRGLCRNELPRVFNRPELVVLTLSPQA